MKPENGATLSGLVAAQDFRVQRGVDVRAVALDQRLAAAKSPSLLILCTSRSSSPNSSRTRS